MVDVLVCVKRVPDSSGQVLLAPDERSVDARHVGYTTSPHEECAVEIATQVAAATGGSATVLSIGTADAVEQLRNALAVGCAEAVLVEADPDGLGPVDVAAEIAEVVRTREPDGGYDLVLLGNDAADSGDFQVGVRLGYALDRPVVTGISTCEVVDERLVARGASPDGTEVFELDLPAVATISEGGVAPRYPSIPGRMKAKRTPIDTRSATVDPVGPSRVRLKLPPEQPSAVEVLGEGPEAAPALVDLFERLGVLSR